MKAHFCATQTTPLLTFVSSELPSETNSFVYGDDIGTKLTHDMSINGQLLCGRVAFVARNMRYPRLLG